MTDERPITLAVVGDSAAGKTTMIEGIEQVLPKAKVDTIMKTTGQENKSGLYALTAVRVDDPALVQELEAAKVSYTGKVENTWAITLPSNGARISCNSPCSIHLPSRRKPWVLTGVTVICDMGWVRPPPDVD